MSEFELGVSVQDRGARMTSGRYGVPSHPHLGEGVSVGVGGGQARGIMNNNTAICQND